MHRTELFLEFTDLIQDAAFVKMYIEKLRKTFLDAKGRLPTAADKEALRATFRHNDATAERDKLSISIVKECITCYGHKARSRVYAIASRSLVDCSSMFTPRQLQLQALAGSVPVRGC